MTSEPQTNGQNTSSENAQKIGFEQAESGIDQILNERQPIIKQSAGTGVADQTEINLVITGIIKMKNLPATQEYYNRALASCALHCQQGVTSPKYADSRIVVEYGIQLKVSEMRAALKSANVTARKFARGIRNIIIKVAKYNLVEGNLSKAYKLENPGFDQQDLVWVSDFQTFNEDPAMPKHVKEWLLENYRKRFRPGTTPVARQLPKQENSQE